MSAHTPGPWRVAPLTGTKDKGHGYVHAANDDLVCAVIAGTAGDPVYSADRILRGIANAHLIAAAPDLLEALQIARDYAAYAQAEAADLALIDAAIAKATGTPA